MTFKRLHDTSSEDVYWGETLICQPPPPSNVAVSIKPRSRGRRRRREVAYDLGGRAGGCTLQALEGVVEEAHSIQSEYHRSVKVVSDIVTIE
jgi:hypothetical protein